MSNSLNIHKYITCSSDDSNWGLYVTGAGYNEVLKKIDYPLVDHPSHHYFHWTVGRRLSDYQFLYITSGKGVFESEVTGRKTINAGDLFILFPGIWHRFSPNKNTGWNEYWIEFNGKIAKHFQDEKYLDPNNPVISVGFNEKLTDCFKNAISLVTNNNIESQCLLSGEVFQILIQLNALKKISIFVDKKDIETKIKQARLCIYEKLNSKVCLNKVAGDLGISYSLFRVEFKRYTGFSPAQYQIELRIRKAKNLLVSTDQSVKEIAYQLGFDSTNYFSRLFKNKVDMTPMEFRLRNVR
jgi:AraC-like DNA-binding protein